MNIIVYVTKSNKSISKISMFVSNQLKKSFDIKVPILFLSVFVISALILVYKIANKEECSTTSFNIDAPSYKVGELIIFSDNSKNAYSWRWYFGDNSQISFRSKVGHSFSKEGEYMVTLVINNECSIDKLITILPRTETIDESLMPKFKAPTYVLEGDEVEFEDRTTGSESWEWRFGETNKVDSFDEKCTYVFSSPGEKMVSLVVNGDYKHVTIKKIFVIPKKEEKEKKVKYKSEVPWNPFQNVSDAPPEEEIITTKIEKGPEIGNADANRINDIVDLVTDGNITYDDFLKYFCKYDLPIVVYKDGKTTPLKTFYYQVKKEKVKIKNLSIQKNQDDCIKVISIDKKYKSVF